MTATGSQISSVAESLALLVATHATLDRATATNLCSTGGATVLAALAVRPDVPADIAASAIRSLWDDLDRAEDPAPTVGFSPAPAAARRVAECESLSPDLQILVASYRGAHCVRVAKHTVAPSVIEHIVAAACAEVETSLRTGGDLEGDPTPTKHNVGVVAAALHLIARSKDEPDLVEKLRTAHVTALLTTLLSAPRYWALAQPAVLAWGLHDAETTSSAVLSTRDEGLICTTGTLGWASGPLREETVLRICAAILSPAESADAPFDALYRVWSRLSVPHQEAIRETIVTSTARDRAAFDATRRSAWLLSLTVVSQDLDAAVDVDLWASIPVEEAERRLDPLGHKLPVDAARVFVAREDVETALAFKVAMASDHHWDGWVYLRAFDEDFVVKVLATSPGKLSRATLTRDRLVRVLTEAVRSSRDAAVRAIAEAHASLFDDPTLLSLPWDVLDAYRAYDSRASTLLAALLAPLFSTSPSIAALTHVLASDGATQMPADAVIGAALAASA